MNLGPGLRLIPDDSGPPPPPETKVLTRTFVAPPGLPWDQARVAQLEARHSAPLPMAQLAYQVRRLEGWRPGAPGRYAAFYVLAKEVAGRLTTTVDADGRDVTVTFLTPELQRARVRGLLTLGVAVALAAFTVSVSLGAALLRRAETEAALSALETRADGKLHAVEARDRLKRQTRALSAQPRLGAPLRDVLSDLEWAAGARTPEAHIEAFHWQPGLFAVEVRGAAAPFEVALDRVVRKSPKPIRRGVWLWGVGARPPLAAAPAARSVEP